MSEFIAGYTVTVLRGVPVDNPFSHGEETADADLNWDSPTQVGAPYPNRPLALDTSVESPTVNAPLAVVEAMTVYLPYGADVRNRDRVRLDGGPHDGTYEVDGKPAHWLGPWTGWEAGCAVRLGSRTGG